MTDILEAIDQRLLTMETRSPLSGSNVYSLLESARDEIRRLRAVVEIAERLVKDDAILCKNRPTVSMLRAVQNMAPEARGCRDQPQMGI